MYRDQPFTLSQFQKDLYRFHLKAQRADDRRRGASTITTISLSENSSKKTERVARIDRTLPLDLSGITRIIRLDDLRNDGEGSTHGGRAYPERQLLRIFAELDDEGARGVMCVKLDLLYGTVGFSFRYRNWGDAEVGIGAHPFTEILLPDSYAKLLALYRICELLDADDAIGCRGLYRSFIAEALSRPEGFGFPKFTREAGQRLLGLYRDCPPVGKTGLAEGVERDAWYVRGFRDKNDPCDANLYFYVGQADVLSWKRERPIWRDDATRVTFENGGHGRATPFHEHYLGDIWLYEDDRFFRIPDDFAPEILRHVLRPPRDASEIMSASLASP